MNDKEILEYFKKNKGIGTNLKITGVLNVLTNLIIYKGWITEDEFNKAVETSVDNIAKKALEEMTQKEREDLEAQIRIEKDPFFGSLFKKYEER